MTHRPVAEPLAHRPYPAHLILEGRPVVVVGAGSVAARRIERLIESGAHVTVVAPDAGAAIRKLAETGRIALREKEFEPSDLAGAFMVHTAANDPSVNEAVVHAVRGIGRAGGHAPLVCAADRSWRDGDFIVPASFDHGVMTISVGTGGHDCRMSRDVKNALRSQVEAIQGADLIVFGVDQRSVSLDRRECLARTLGDLDRVKASLAALRSVQEFFLLVTCNRVEAYLVAGMDPVAEDLAARILGFDAIDPAQRYIRRGREAFVHLSLVMSGAYAALFGETGIVKQVREAFEKSRTEGRAGASLGRYVDEALCVSRRVRSAVMEGVATREVEDLAVARIRAGRSDLHHVLVVGTGAVGRAVVTRLNGFAERIHWAYFRHCPDTSDLPNAARVGVLHADDVRDVLPECDVVVVASGAKDPILGPDDVPVLRDRCPLVLDLSVPRGVDPVLCDSGCVEVVDLQALVGGARPSDVGALMALAEESARLESYRHLPEDRAL